MANSQVTSLRDLSISRIGDESSTRGGDSRKQVSYNKLKTFKECTIIYRLAYIERQPKPPIAAVAFHLRLHSALANYHFLAKRDGIVLEEDLLRPYAESWDVARNPEARDTTNFREGEEILLRYCKTDKETGRIPAYLEHPLHVDYGPYTLTGTVDRIDFAEGGRYSIVDYKLDRKLHNTNAADTGDHLSFYMLLVSEGLGMTIQDMRLYYLRHGIERTQLKWLDHRDGSIPGFSGTFTG